MDVPVRPDLSEENLRQLLSQGVESETLDYKSSCDISQHDALLEIVKDIAAMQLLGGYIVIGVDDHGRPTGGVTNADIRQFEQASLAAKVRHYLPDPLDIRSRHHVIGEDQYILAYVAPNPEGLCVIRAVGTNSKNKTIFQPGDVFARHGTASERWNQQDVRKIEQKITARLKNAWTQDATEVLSQQTTAIEAGHLSTLPTAALTWALDGDSFHAIIVELLRRNDLVPIRLLLDGARRDCAPLLEYEESAERLETILDRLTCIGALAIQVRSREIFSECIDTFLRIYNLPIGGDGLSVHPDQAAASRLWLRVITRMCGLGALAYRKQAWVDLAIIVSQRGKGNDHRYYTNWFRHALTMAARSGYLHEKRTDGQGVTTLISHAQQHIDRLSCLRPDLPESNEEILNSLCQFDFLVSVASVGQAKSPQEAKFYPNFARYFSYRTTPAAERLIDDHKLRQLVFPQDDRALAYALNEVDEIAQHQSGLLNGWSGYRDYGGTSVREFIESHVR